MHNANLLVAFFAVLTVAIGLPLARADGEPAFEAALNQHFYYGPPKPEPEVVSDPKYGQQLDANYFQRFIEFDRSYSPKSRDAAQRMASSLVRDAQSLTHEQFVLRVAEIAAQADNAHTAVQTNAFKKNTKRVPLRTYLFADGLHVLYAASAHRTLLGARIDRINGRTVADIFNKLQRYRGGLPHYRRLHLLPVLESPALFEAAGLAGSSNGLTLAGVLASGISFSTFITAEERDRSAWVSTTSRLLFPDQFKDHGMISYLKTSGTKSPFFHAAHDLFWSERIETGYYIHLAHNDDADESPIGVFLDKISSEIKAIQPRFVILDMRLNEGGDYTKTYAFARALPQIASGATIYVFTSGWTFSAAITTVAALKEAGKGQVKIVGDPVGDRLDFWAEGGAFNLPNSFVRVSYATGRHVYTGPCRDRETCYWLNERFPVRVSSIAPEIAAPFTFAAFRNGRDPAIDAVLKRESRLTNTR